MGVLGASPAGMPLPQISDALRKGTVMGCTIPWEVLPLIKVKELTGFHTEFNPSGGSLGGTTFVMAMNKTKYDSLALDLKKVIDNNSDLVTSTWQGKTQQGNDGFGRETANDRGNMIAAI